MAKKYTMQEIADFYNECSENKSLDVGKLESMIEDSGFISDCGETWGVCHNDTEKVIIDDCGLAFVTSND